MRPRRTALVLIAVMAGCVAASGCGGSDKAGGPPRPLVLRIAAHKVDYFATLFTDQVRQLSKGGMRVEFIPGNGDNDPPDAFVRFARQVRDGRYDLGVIEAAAWDKLGVRSLEPLQAPFLITSQALFRAVLASPLGNRMLAGVRAQHVVGLSLMMLWLERPLGYQGPLTSLADFRGKRIHVEVSRLNDALVSALGGTPVHLTDVAPSVARHQVDGDESSPFPPPQAWLTANVELYADALTVIANQKRYHHLSDEQRRILRTAAARAAQGAAGVVAANSDARMIPRYCAGGHVVMASRSDLAALGQAARPVYAQLERDPQVRATIAGIRELKRHTQPDPAPKIPASCLRNAAPGLGQARDPSFLDGSYRWRITRAGALRRGGDPKDPSIGTIGGMTLRGGRWALGVPGSSTGTPTDHGTFKVAGNRLAFNWPQVGYTLTFTFTRRADGTLDVTPVLPMDVGDRVVWSSAPWTRIGPPVGKTP
jgi:TRAP-type C4-dicarboxylate transport system substrate-binding protein